VSGDLDLVCEDEVPISRLHVPCPTQPMLQPLRVQAATMQSPFRVFQPVLLYVHVTVMARFLFHGLCLLVLTPLPVPLFTLKLDCPAGWWPMPFRVCLISICFFFFLPVTLLVVVRG
jgi:hypothetical protein